MCTLHDFLSSKVSNNDYYYYFDHYREIIKRQPVRPLRQHLIHPPFLRTVYAECTPLYQLIKLINTLKTDKSDTILEKLATRNCSYS